MKVLEHFNRANNATHILYRLKKGEWSKLLGKIPEEFRKCYITDAALTDLSAKLGMSKADYLDKYVIPDRPNILSGDFGEILSYWAVRDNFHSKGIPVIGPKKWLFKNDKNNAVKGADALLFHRINPKKPSKKDLLISIESKMKAVASNGHRMQDAVDGATQDKKTRMAKTLIWLEEKHAKEGNLALVQYVQRFNDPATHGDFNKEFKAIAIVDETLEVGETGKTFTNPLNVTVIVFSIEDLKKAYEDTRKNIIKSV
jgi:hypothetical protein